MKKLVVNVLLAFCICISFCFNESFKASAEYTPTSDAYTLVNYLNNKVGETFTSNACQAFVYQSLKNCLGVSNTKTSCCATKAWQNYGVSSSRDDIPLGAAVYFGGSNVTDSSCGQKAGHVGLYVGDGYIVHAWSSMVKKTTIDYVISCGYPYRGWGWQGEYALATEMPADTEAPTISGLGVKDVNGESFTIECNLNDNIGVTRLWFVLYAPGGEYQFGASASNGYYSKKLYTKDHGGAGIYSLHLYAYDAAGNSVKDQKSDINATSVYTITYDANGGIGAPSPQIKKYGETITLSTVWPSRPGFDFWGWATSPNATTATYPAGGAFAYNGNITLYAFWKPKAYTTITYDANGGTGAPAPQIKPHGEMVQLSTQWPSKPGYIFWGWAISADSVAIYPSGGSYSADGDITLYAYWKPNLNLTVNKSEILINEPITFSYDFSHSPSVWICIDKDGENYADSFILEPTSYTRSFADPGTYTAVICVYNGNDYYETNQVTFVVSPNLNLITDKNEISVGDSITFNYDFSYTTAVWVLIDKDNTDYMDLYVAAPTSYTMSFDEPGTYTVSVGIYRTEGFCETNQVTITVSGVDSTVTKSDNILTVRTSLYRITNNCTVIVVGYKNGEFVSLTSVPCDQEEINTTLSGDIDEIKVMVWDSLSGLKPLCDAEVIPSSEWIKA